MKLQKVIEVIGDCTFLLEWQKQALIESLGVDREAEYLATKHDLEEGVDYERIGYQNP